VGGQLAELLDLPAITSVVRLEVTDSEAFVHRRLVRGRREVLRCPLPAVFAVEEGINRPRYPKLRVLLRSLRVEVPHRGLAELGLRPEEVGEAGSCTHVLKLSPPKPITRGLFIPDSSLSPEERWQQIISGGVEERDGDVIQGSPDTVAERLLQFMTENNFV
jgi:electron transfer flavoprotein beta subunit